MAVVILGGLVTSTLLNLFVVPPLYLWLGRRKPLVTPLAPSEERGPREEREPATVA
jgi:hypothetical protein